MRILDNLYTSKYFLILKYVLFRSNTLKTFLYIYIKKSIQSHRFSMFTHYTYILHSEKSPILIRSVKLSG